MRSQRRQERHRLPLLLSVVSQSLHLKFCMCNIGSLMPSFFSYILLNNSIWYKVFCTEGLKIWSACTLKFKRYLKQIINCITYQQFYMDHTLLTKRVMSLSISKYYMISHILLSFRYYLISFYKICHYFTVQYLLKSEQQESDHIWISVFIFILFYFYLLYFIFV